MFDIVIPEDLPEAIRTVLQRMADSGQSEAKAMAECICDVLADCDQEPSEMVLAMAGEFVGWGQAIIKAASSLSEPGNLDDDMALELLKAYIEGPDEEAAAAVLRRYAAAYPDRETVRMILDRLPK